MSVSFNFWRARHSMTSSTVLPVTSLPRVTASGRVEAGADPLDDQHVFLLADAMHASGRLQVHLRVPVATRAAVKRCTVRRGRVHQS